MLYRDAAQTRPDEIGAGFVLFYSTVYVGIAFSDGTVFTMLKSKVVQPLKDDGEPLNFPAYLSEMSHRAYSLEGLRTGRKC